MVDDDMEIPHTSFAEAYDDAPASILTPAQREYFLGEREVNEGSERALLGRIHHRLRAACWDLSLSVRAYPETEIGKFHSDDNRLPPFPALAGFLYAAQPQDGMIIEDLDLDGEPKGRDRRAAWLENDIKKGIKQAIHHREGTDAEVEVSITIDRSDSLASMAEGDLTRLTREQLDALLYTGTIDNEEYIETVNQQLEGIFGRG